jgi:dipeptidyl aminopeptidase/acylaminoacyl peptidase
MHLGKTVSEYSNVAFSKSGIRLFFGTAPVATMKDTTLVDIDLVKLDIWHYKDDHLQSQQLFALQNELRRNFLTFYDFTKNQMEHLGSKELPTVLPTADGDGKFFVAVTDTGRRIAAQWAGSTLKDIYAINMNTGERTLIKKNHKGQVYPSANGQYIVLYDPSTKHYHSWNGKGLVNITSKINTPLYDEEHDSPSDPSPYGIASWHEKDSFVYINDRYDIWRVDPNNIQPPVNLTKGRSAKRVTRFVRLDTENQFWRTGEPVYFRVQEQVSKKTGLVYTILNKQPNFKTLSELGTYNYTLAAKAKSAPVLLFTQENYVSSPNLMVKQADGPAITLTHLNTQQDSLNWGTAELFKWKTFNGKSSEGILYKPENFDPNKKYPMLIYFYEKVTDGLFNYIAPGPTPSRLNIPFYVSRGYIVFAPDISYTKGHPAKDAYNYIVSGAQELAKNKWVDAKNIGIQGQSWGGYQVMALITQTNMFKAAWAGAPVVNMTSAYGGIRWESGVNRQFQYEKTQSRIGATLWERQDLYLENSPLFHFKKVNTPVVIMSNDADGAVPWYQGIEAFTALRRLNKPVWMLNYNGEAHNLVERKNRKDIQIRQQQYFDWLLKGEKPAKWITEGVPAVKKGKDWGLEIVD